MVSKATCPMTGARQEAIRQVREIESLVSELHRMAVGIISEFHGLSVRFADDAIVDHANRAVKRANLEGILLVVEALAARFGDDHEAVKIAHRVRETTEKRINGVP